MRACPHCQTALLEQALRCFQCKRWVNQLSTLDCLKQYCQAFAQQWILYVGISLFFAGIVIALSLQTLNFHWIETLRFAFGHIIRAWLWFSAAAVIIYLWVRPLAFRSNHRLMPAVKLGLIVVFIFCQYAESWSVPQFLRYYNTKQETLAQIHLRERVNRHEWFGKTTRAKHFNPKAVGNTRLTLSVNGLSGTFGINPTLQHSVIFQRFTSRHLVELPPSVNTLKAGNEAWSPVYLNWSIDHDAPITDVLTWVQVDGENSELDGIIGQDILSRLERMNHNVKSQ